MVQRMLIVGLVTATFIAAVPTTRGEVDPVTVATLARSLMSDDSHERITAVAELHKLGGEAKPALPSLRAAMGRERDLQIRAMMLRAINDIERGGPSPREVATDVAAHALRLTELIDALAKPDAEARLAAIDELRGMGAMAFPALDDLKTIADKTRDRAEQNAALAAIAGIRRELWFHQADAPVEPAKPDPASGRPTRLRGYAASIVAIIWELTGKLEDANAKVRVRALRQLASYDAAAETALPALRRMARDDKDDTVRKLAALAVDRIDKAVEATKAVREAEGNGGPPGAEGK